ncbi:MAG: glycosyltransferase [Candidatus Micrarchaeia archaeon]|jgi:glycosyltransferase involved in cell wall biosynthesis
MDLVVLEPCLSYRSGGTRVVLEIANRFNPVIYTLEYDKKKAFPGFRAHDVRIIKPNPLESCLIRSSLARNRHDAGPVTGASYINFLKMKIRHDYDVLNPNGVPSEWIRNRNGRVCWYCHTPSRMAFDLHDFSMGKYGVAQRLAMEPQLSLFRLIDRHIAKKIERICVNSLNTKGRVGKYLHRQDAEIVHPGVNPQDFQCEGYGDFFFYPTRFVPEKRVEYAIEAFRKFSRISKGGKFKLIVSGYVQNRQEEGYLQRLAALSGGSDISFAKNPSNAEFSGFYANCRSVIFSAINEDWGMVPLEAMASRKPVISVDEGGPRESIVDGKTGYLVNSTGEMAERMRLLADNPGTCEKMGKAGRRRVEQNYTWKIFLDKMEKAFKQTAKM